MIFLLLILINQRKSQTLSFTNNKNANTYRVKTDQYNIEQSVYNVYFVQDISEHDINLFISIGLQFTYPQDGYVNANFSCSYNDSTQLNVVTERNGMNLRKQDQMIRFQAQSFKLGTRLICQISKLNDELYKYQIKFNKNNNTRCYNDCQDQGICVEQIGLCRCGTNLLDLDCSKKAFPLQISNLINEITFTNHQYFYIDTNRPIDILQLRIVSKNQTNYITGYVMKENFIDGVPSAQNSEFSFMVSPGKSELEFNFDLRSLKYNTNLQRYDRFLITLESQFTSVVTLQITPINTNDKQMEIFLYFGVAIGIVICLAVMVLYLYQHHKNARFARVSDVSRFNPEQNRSQYFSSIRTSETIQTEPNMQASFIDQYMAVVLYKNIKNTTKNKYHKIYTLMRNTQKDQCSICLVEYEPDSKCRLTLCYHLFHSECILQWIDSHQTCPICRKDLGRVELQRMETEEFRTSIRRSL